MSKKDNYIFYNGERLDMSDWILMSIKLELEGQDHSDGYIRKLKFRTKHNKGGKTIDYREIPELKLTLVKK